MEWRAALGVLQSHGWQREEIVAAADALGGDTPGRPDESIRAAVAQALDRTYRLDSLPLEHDLEPGSWERMVARAAASNAVAEALVVASREWWAENEALDDELRRLSPSG